MELNFNSNDFNKLIPTILNYVSELKDGEYTLTVEKKKQKKSLTANGYLWVLCDKIAKAISEGDALYTKEDIYRKAIKQVGIFKDFHLQDDEVKTFKVAWERLGIGYFTEDLEIGNIVRAYYGSSGYSQKQLSRIIDYVIQDCKAIGIETMSPQKLELLIGSWE